MGTINVSTDISKNRVYIKLDGFFSDEETLQLVAKVLPEFKRLRSPFDFVTDVTTFKPATQLGFENIKAGTAEMVKMGVRKLVRIDSHSGAGSMQINRLSKTVGYEVVQVNSLQEADKFLDDLR